MTEHPEQVIRTALRLPPATPVIALIETALGIDNASAIARAPGVFRLAFGIGDFRRDAGASDDPIALAYARGRLVVASRAGGLPGHGQDLEAACRTTVSMGMTGKLCLHPNTAAVINTALAPSKAEIRWAADLLQAHARSQAGSDDASYLPRLSRARNITALAGRLRSRYMHLRGADPMTVIIVGVDGGDTVLKAAEPAGNSAVGQTRHCMLSLPPTTAAPKSSTAELTGG